MTPGTLCYFEKRWRRINKTNVVRAIVPPIHEVPKKSVNQWIREQARKLPRRGGTLVITLIDLSSYRQELERKSIKEMTKKFPASVKALAALVPDPIPELETPGMLDIGIWHTKEDWPDRAPPPPHIKPKLPTYLKL